jgi:hypothetical protein
MTEVFYIILGAIISGVASYLTSKRLYNEERKERIRESKTNRYIDMQKQLIELRGETVKFPADYTPTHSAEENELMINTYRIQNTILKSILNSSGDATLKSAGAKVDLEKPGFHITEIDNSISHISQQIAELEK